jgi:hypothetical protein
MSPFKFTQAAVLAFSAFMALTAVTPAHADSDDVKWVGQCVSDNKDEGQSVDVIASYCSCMNDQMSSSESQSITQWEKSHKKEMEACATKAGWKGK